MKVLVLLLCCGHGLLQGCWRAVSSTVHWLRRGRLWRTDRLLPRGVWLWLLLLLLVLCQICAIKRTFSAVAAG